MVSFHSYVNVYQRVMLRLSFFRSHLKTDLIWFYQQRVPPKSTGRENHLLHCAMAANSVLCQYAPFWELHLNPNERGSPFSLDTVNITLYNMIIYIYTYIYIYIRIYIYTWYSSKLFDAELPYIFRWNRSVLLHFWPSSDHLQPMSWIWRHQGIIGESPISEAAGHHPLEFIAFIPPKLMVYHWCASSNNLGHPQSSLF